MTRFAKFFSAAAGFALLASAAIAHATPMSITYSNTSTNAGGPECCFQVVLTDESSTDVNVAVTLLDGATFFASTGSGQHPGFAFDLSGDPGNLTINLSSTDSSNTNWTFGGGSSPNANNDPVTTGGPSLGDLDYQLNLNSGGTSGKVSTLTFDIVDPSGINFTDFDDPNADGVLFVADILGGNNGLTGLSAIRTPVTPEPSSLILLGTGIVGSAFLLRRRMKGAPVSS